MFCIQNHPSSTFCLWHFLTCHWFFDELSPGKKSLALNHHVTPTSYDYILGNPGLHEAEWSLVTLAFKKLTSTTALQAERTACLEQRDGALRQKGRSS